MTNKHILRSIFLAALSGAIIVSAHAADKPAVKGMVLIPAGEFIMGSDRQDDPSKWRDANALNPFGFRDRLYVDEHPMHKVMLPDFMIDQYEVTNAQYREYVTLTGRTPPYAWVRNGYDFTDELLGYLPLEELRQIATDKFKLDMDTTKMSRDALLAELDKIQNERGAFPVTAVSWAEANNYCKWLGKRLPTEAEWEKAARGTQGLEYPWGNEWNPKNVNSASGDDEIPYSKVGSFSGDKSVYGVYDMAANVAEWTADWYDAYPGAAPSDNKFFGKTQRAVRGGMASSGHYDSLSVVFRAAKRTHLLPQAALIDVGFRCAQDVK